MNRLNKYISKLLPIVLWLSATTVFAVSSDTLTILFAGDLMQHEAQIKAAKRENGVYDFEGPLGITEIEIRDGRARVISSPCRNGICMEAGWSGTLCCLPNKIIATTTADEGALDAISG